MPPLPDRPKLPGQRVSEMPPTLETRHLNPPRHSDLPFHSIYRHGFVRVAACTPGFVSMEILDANHFKPVVGVGLGAVKAKFTLDVQVTERQEPVLHHAGRQLVQRVLLEAEHSGLVENRRDAVESSRAIRDVVTAVRGSARLGAE